MNCVFSQKNRLCQYVDQARVQDPGGVGRVGVGAGRPRHAAPPLAPPPPRGQESARHARHLPSHGRVPVMLKTSHYYKQRLKNFMWYNSKSCRKLLKLNNKKIPIVYSISLYIKHLAPKNVHTFSSRWEQCIKYVQWYVHPSLNCRCLCTMLHQFVNKM